MSGPGTDAAGAAAPPRPEVRPRRPAPEPANFWIRYAPRRWPPPDRFWLDPLRGALGRRPGEWGTAAADAPLPRLDGAPFGDVLWLPPVAPQRAAERDRLAAAHLEHGTPVMVQVIAGDPVPAGVAAGTTVLHDLTEALLAGDLESLAALPSGGAAVWPLVRGRSDDPVLWRDGCAALAAAGVTAVQTTLPRLDTRGRRRLAEGAAEDAYHRLFHGPEPDERAFARVAAAAGLEVFVPRPLPRPPASGAADRKLAAALYLVAELWLRLGRSPSQGQAYFRAARWCDESGYDLEALAREGNLAVVEAVDRSSREVLEDAAARGGAPALLQDLLREYLSDEPPEEERDAPT